MSEIWGGVVKPTPEILKFGRVTAAMRLVKTVHIATGQLIPVNPPIPALRRMESSFGRVWTSFRARSRMEWREVRSSRSGWKKIRVCAFWGWRARCCFSRLTVDALFFSSRVVTMMRKDCEPGRFAINSSIRRQQMAKPRPLRIDQQSLKKDEDKT